MHTTQYTIMTPYGSFVATWGEDADKPVQYSGDEGARAYFRDYLELRVVSGTRGAVLNMDSLEAADMYGFCQSKEYGIIALPDPEAQLALLAGADDASNNELIGVP